MGKHNDLELETDDIVDAAIVILRERGLDAVSMRSVAERLSVSPMPLYTRVGNKAALIDAVADQLLADLAPPGRRGGGVACVCRAMVPRVAKPTQAGSRQSSLSRRGPGCVRGGVPTVADCDA